MSGIPQDAKASELSIKNAALATIFISLANSFIMRGVWVSPCYPGVPGNSDGKVTVGNDFSDPDF
jgi:hypothetical protein